MLDDMSPLNNRSAGRDRQGQLDQCSNFKDEQTEALRSYMTKWESHK